MPIGWAWIPDATKEPANYLTDGTGAGLKWGNFAFDMTYSYIIANGRDYKENQEYGVLDSKARAGYTRIISGSLMYMF